MTSGGSGDAQPQPLGEGFDRNRGEQPFAALLKEPALGSRDLVKASTDQITHKMVARGSRGRWLTPNTRGKLVRALNAAANTAYRERDLFND